MKLSLSNIPVQIHDTEIEVIKSAAQMVCQLPPGSCIAVWPDQIGRALLAEISKQLTHEILCYTLGSFRGVDLVGYLAPVIKLNDKESSLRLTQQMPRSIDLCFIQPRPTLLDAALITINPLCKPHKTQFLIDEIGAAYGYERAGSMVRSDCESSESEAEDPHSPGRSTCSPQSSNHAAFSQIPLESLLQITKHFVFVFKGDLYKDACTAVAECKLGTCGQLLQQASSSSVLCDVLSSSGLTQIIRPWTQKGFHWNHRAAKMAFAQAAARLNCPILDLRAEDFEAVDIPISEEAFAHYKPYVLEDLSNRIITIDQGFFPGQTLKVLVFSPHPDDDVISAGAAVRSLAASSNVELHVTYCVSGAVAVPDSFVMDKINQHKVELKLLPTSETDNLGDQIAYCSSPADAKGDITKAAYVTHRNLTDAEAATRFSSGMTPKSKGLLREIEAMSALDTIGFFKKQENQAHFLRLPFYGSGFGRRDAPGRDDTLRVIRLLAEVQPQVIFLAGDLSDPHGTHGFCYQVIKEALEEFEKREGIVPPHDWVSVYNTRIITKELSPKELADRVAQGKYIYKLMYRGAWSEFNLEDSTFIIKFSAQEMEDKMLTIREHYSQMGEALYLGGDKRAFDVRAKERNHGTALFLRALGLANDAADGAECFVGSFILP